MGSAGGTGNTLVHQSAAEVIGTGVQTHFRALDPHLDPRSLDVGDMGVQH